MGARPPKNSAHPPPKKEKNQIGQIIQLFKLLIGPTEIFWAKIV